VNDPAPIEQPTISQAHALTVVEHLVSNIATGNPCVLGDDPILDELTRTDHFLVATHAAGVITDLVMMFAAWVDTDRMMADHMGGVDISAEVRPTTVMDMLGLVITNRLRALDPSRANEG